MFLRATGAIHKCAINRRAYAPTAWPAAKNSSTGYSLKSKGKKVLWRTEGQFRNYFEIAKEGRNR